MKTLKILSIIVMIFTAFVLAYLRIDGHKSQLFQATAHLFVGGLIVAAITKKSWWCGGTAIVISLVELGVFIHDKAKG